MELEGVGMVIEMMVLSRLHTGDGLQTKWNVRVHGGAHYADEQGMYMACFLQMQVFYLAKSFRLLFYALCAHDQRLLRLFFDDVVTRMRTRAHSTELSHSKKQQLLWMCFT